ncbi:hypothetical protein D3C81_2257900 [compost metagenome]
MQRLIHRDGPLRFINHETMLLMRQLCRLPDPLLHTTNQLINTVYRFLTFVCQLADLLRHDCKTRTFFASSCSLNGCIQGK